VQRPLQQRADGECAELALRAHKDVFPVRVPPCCRRRLRVRPSRVGSVGSAPSARHVGGCMSGASSRGDAAAGPVAVLSEGTSGTRCDLENSRGAPSYGYGARVPSGAHGCCEVRRSTAERPSPPRVCRYLYNNKLTGSVPSSLSALSNLASLCVPPSSHHCLRVWPSRVGWVGSAPTTRHVGGCMSGASSRGDAAAGPVAVLLEGTSGTRCDEGVLKGHPILWVRYAGTERAHGCCGCGVSSSRVRLGCAATSTRTR
jgi:hypothetical protein